MHRYSYTLSAATELGSAPDRLTGTIEAHHPMTHQQIRLAAIDKAPAEHQLKREEHQRKLQAMRNDPPPRNLRTSLVMCAMVAALSSAQAVDISEPQWKLKKRRA
ncbi:hypothetical protein [Aeromonas veronii]|uniref:hypothetical protein n=1 Tax=Aeromonas veronii TaxID=654 RepID=UPI00191EFDB8|nr:hypothetical protein [Aeromonas veronii]MBL0487748.1 hypothetical protein [Aeromonas veronii]